MHVQGKRASSSAVSVWAKRYLLLPALFRKHAQRPAILGLTFSIPTRLQSILIFLYIFFNAFALGWGFGLYEDNYYWPGDASAQALRYISDRSGVLSCE